MITAKVNWFFLYKIHKNSSQLKMSAIMQIHCDDDVNYCTNKVEKMAVERGVYLKSELDEGSSDQKLIFKLPKAKWRILSVFSNVKLKGMDSMGYHNKWPDI